MNSYEQQEKAKAFNAIARKTKSGASDSAWISGFCKNTLTKIKTHLNSRNPLRRGRPSKIVDTAGWDWTKPDVENAREHKIDQRFVSRARRMMGIKAAFNPTTRAMEERRCWDWEKTDAAVGREHGFSRERARQLRVRLGLPSRMDELEMERSYQERRFMEWVNGRKEIVFLDAKHQSFAASSILTWCKKHGIVRIAKITKNGKWPWQLVNFNLPNCLIEKAWGMARFVPASRRSTRGIFKALTISKGNKGQIDKLFAAEQIKVEQWRKQCAVMEANRQ